MLRCFWLLLPLGEGWDEGKKAQENVNFRLFKQPLSFLSNKQANKQTSTYASINPIPNT
jgi:hypothetical protein